MDSLGILDRRNTLNDMVAGLFSVSLNEACAGCGFLTGGAGDIPPDAKCAGISEIYVNGAEFFSGDRKILLRLESDVIPDAACERRIRGFLAELFGCEEVLLQFEKQAPAQEPTPKPEQEQAPEPEYETAQEQTPEPERDRAPEIEYTPESETAIKTEAAFEFEAALEAEAAFVPEPAFDFEYIPDAAPPPPVKRPAKKQAKPRSSNTYYDGPKKRRKSSREKIRAGDFVSSMKDIDFEDGSYFRQNPQVICGAPITEKPMPISRLTADQRERVAVRGEVIMLDYRQIKNGETEILECGISDGSGSIAVKLFIPSEHVRLIKPMIKTGDWLTVYGELQYDAYQKEPAVYAVDISRYEKKIRADDAGVKRVELHMHTRMSALDAMTPVEELVKRAAWFGHPAIAVTDHGVAQAFPDAHEAGRAHNIKIIYGVEAYLDPGPAASAENRARREAGMASNAQRLPNGDGSLAGDGNGGLVGSGINGGLAGNANGGPSGGSNSGPNGEGYGLFHIIILVKNLTGLKNLYKLISKSHIDYFYRRPRMPRNEIAAHREGLIIGSACEAGELFAAVRDMKSDGELAEIAAFYDYLEIQPIANNMFLLREDAFNSEEDLRELNRRVVRLGDALGKPVAATCDVHFLDPEDEIFRRILMSGQGYQDADSQPPLYLRTTSEMLDEFAYLGVEKAYEVVVTNTNLINGWIEDGIRPIPDGTFTPVQEGSEDELKRIVEANARLFYGDRLHGLIRERIDQEMEVIISKKFSLLYMIAHKLVKKSNEEGYIVGSRGSVGSSVVAMLAGITEINPLPPHYLCGNCKYIEFVPETGVSSGFDLPDKNCPECGRDMAQDGQDIMFEIFIGAKGSEKAPDIDLNFSGELQQRAHKYAEELFGAANVFKAGTIATVANKTAYGFVKKYLESKNMSPGKIEEERLTRGVTGVKRTTGQHPGGIIVVPHDKEVYDFTPVQRPADATDSNIITTHFDYSALQETILKLDILGHDDPSVIKMLEELTGVRADSVKMNDPDIMSLFAGTEALGVAPDDIGSPVGTIGLPEFGTRFIRQMLVETRPKNFSDLLQISGLSHGTNVWLNNAQELIRKGLCTISEVIGTREILVRYLMGRGLDPLTSFKIMEAVRKKRGVSEENEKKMLEKGVPAWYIESCNKIGYLFTKAHAAAYVMMAYRQAWYKINTPAEFYAAYYTIRADEFDAAVMTKGQQKAKLRLADLNKLGRDISQREQNILTILEVVVEMYARGIEFLPVDLYRSDALKFTIEDGKIRPPFASLSGLGESAAVNLRDARTGKPFLSIEDLVRRAKISKSVAEILKNYGALAGMPDESQLSLFDIMRI